MHHLVYVVNFVNFAMILFLFLNLLDQKLNHIVVYITNHMLPTNTLRYDYKLFIYKIQECVLGLSI